MVDACEALASPTQFDAPRQIYMGVDEKIVPRRETPNNYPGRERTLKGRTSVVMRRKRGPRIRKRKVEQWICHSFPSCACGRASNYSTQPLHRYSGGAKDRFAIADSFVILNCMADHAPDRGVRIDALCQLMRPKYDTYHQPPWFVRVQEFSREPPI